MHVIDVIVTLGVVLAALLFYKYSWLKNKMWLFEVDPAVYENPHNLPWWYVGDTCRYTRRK